MNPDSVIRPALWASVPTLALAFALVCPVVTGQEPEPAAPAAAPAADAATESTGEVSTETRQPVQPRGKKEEGPWISPLVFLFIPLLLFYVLLILPERRKRAEVTKRLSAIKKNDRVVTIGGIHGVVVQAGDSDEILIRVDEATGTRLRMNRSAIAQVLGGDDAAEKSSG